MTERENDTTIIKTDSPKGNGAGWFFVGAFAVVAVVLGYLYLGENAQDDSLVVTFDAPKVEVPTMQ